MNIVNKAVKVILPLLLIVGSVLFICSCYLTGPRLTPQDRKNDIEYLAQWAREYSPFVELNEKLRGLPSYEALKPKYVQLAQQAKDNVEYLQVVYGYTSLIGASGHRDIFSTNRKRLFFESKSAYWHRNFYDRCIVHPPFLLVLRGDEYISLTDYENEDTHIPKGSKILSVNGMTCQAYCDYVRSNTWVRFVAGPTEGLDRRLLLVNEGKDFKGWKIAFLLPDQTVANRFVPAEKGPTSFKTEFCNVSKGNCVCLALTDDVGYIRIKSLGPKHVEPDRETIHAFFELSASRFSKLIIDVRDNPGGTTEYFYENLIKSFLDQPVSYKHVTGLKRRFIEDHSQAYIDGIRFTVSSLANETNIVEVSSPPEFDSREWVFYEISRELNTRTRYDFEGDIFVLINERTGSAADDFANAIKRTGIAILVGQSTYGSAAAYIGPVVVRLPESGMEFRLEADLLVNQDGSYNEIVGTSPDIVLPSTASPLTVTKEALLNDEWIKKIIGEL
jgi:hypothetical protein